MVIEVSGCNDCPFRVDEYDGWSMGYDSISYCNIAKHKQVNWIITSYDRVGAPEITTPDWCPLEEMTVKKSPKNTL